MSAGRSGMWERCSPVRKQWNSWCSFHFGEKPPAGLESRLHMAGLNMVSSRSIPRLLLVSPCVLAVLVACGSEGSSVFQEPATENAVSSMPPSAPPPGRLGTGGPVTADPAPDAQADDAGGACAETHAVASLTPVNLVVMFDQSGSMGDTKEDPAFDPALRWIPVREAMKAFFSDATSTGMSATLTFFPQRATPASPDSCTAADYAKADVALTPLPSADFGKSLDAHAPKGDTPTRAAVAGAINQATAIAAAHPKEKTVLVLVTDGEPYGCGITVETSNQEAARVAQDVAAVKSTIPTYVVGVGPSVQNLDAVAAAGGTNTAFNVQVGTPAQTSQQFLAAMSQIRGSLAQCDFDVPSPPDGRQLEYDKVNVAYTPASGATTVLPYSQDCATGAGWHFDDPNAPKQVQLCASTCNAVKSDAGGKVDVSFTCAARPDTLH